MNECNLIVEEALNAAEGDVQHGDLGFEFAKDSVGVPPTKHWSAPRPRRCPPAETVSDSNTDPWISMTFGYVGFLSVAPDPESREFFLSEREAFFLTQVLKDLAELSEPVRSSASAKLCKRFAEGVGLDLANIPQARCAVFGDEEDGVELVAHSRASMRQVSFEFGDDERTINIVSIDEQMRRDARQCLINHVLTLGNAIAWLNPH